jgi:hypothetical protein
MAIKCWDHADKAGFIMLWRGTARCGDDFVPEKYEFEVEFDLVNNVQEGRGAYLSMMTYNVNYKYNGVYLNGTKISNLTVWGDKWGIDTFCIPAGIIKKGKNTFKITARNASGGFTGNVDDILVRDPLLIYAVK